MFDPSEAAMKRASHAEAVYSSALPPTLPETHLHTSLLRPLQETMAPVKVQVLPQGLPCGAQVTIDIETSTPLLEVKRQLQLATGIPIEYQKVMLSGINQVVLGDKRTQKFAHCGSASSLHFAVTAPPKESA